MDMFRIRTFFIMIIKSVIIRFENSRYVVSYFSETKKDALDILLFHQFGNYVSSETDRTVVQRYIVRLYNAC